MKSIFDEFDAILAALKISEIKPYVRSARGKYEGEKGKELWIKDYVGKVLPEIEQEYISCAYENFRDAFYRDEKYRGGNGICEEVNKDIEENIHNVLSKIFANFTYKNYFFDLTKFSRDMSLEEVEDEIALNPEAYEDVKAFILDSDWAKELPTYKEWLKGYLKDMKQQIYKDAVIEAEDMFEKNALTVEKLHVYDPLFGKKDRISPEELRFNTNEMAKIYDDVSEKFNKELEELAKEYFKFIGNPTEYDALEEAISDTSRKIPDYFNTGKYTFFSDPRRQINVGRIIKRVLEFDPDGEKVNWLSKTFVRKTTSKNNEKVRIVISRHPYDIAGMSTDRGWRSCMELHEGMYKDYVFSTVNAGVLIAYLCNEDDTTDIVDSKGEHHKNTKLNIQKPLGRVLIKPYYNSEDKQMNYEKPNFILKCSAEYGTFWPKALDKLQEWLDKNWNDDIFDESHFYTLDTQSIYKDRHDRDEF